MPWYLCTPLLVSLLFTFGCVTQVNDQVEKKADYNAKEMMQKWRTQMTIQDRYPYYLDNQDNPSALEETPTKAYPVYTPEDDNPPSYYYLVPAEKNPRPPKDGFNAPLFRKPAK